MKMAKRYYSSIFYEMESNLSIWNVITDFYVENTLPTFTTFLEEIFKCHFDQLTLIKSQKLSSRKIA